MKTVILLLISNIFMTIAWYGHLKYKDSPLWIAILVSWLIAFVEYCFQVPANRIGHYQFSAAQLKTIQEIITLIVFAVFFGYISQRTFQVELRSRVPFYGCRRVLYVPQMGVSRPNE